MKNHKKFIEETKLILNRYKDIKIKKQGNKKEKIIITGSYNLFRKYNGKTYEETFNLEISVSDDDKELLPKVKCLDGVPRGFNHVYRDDTCCLGLSYEIFDAWEPRTAKAFFEKILDVYLINLISFRDDNKCITGERPHRGKGVTEYYSKFFTDISDEKIRNVLKYLHDKSKRNERINKRSPCPCGSGKKLIDCHHIAFNDFYDTLKGDFKEAFINDFKMYENKGRGRPVGTKKT